MNSPLKYIGGKSKLAKTIIEMMPEHRAYCEVFAGAAWVFFRKDQSKYEVINDLDGDLIRFYRVLQHHLEEFLKQYKWILSSREWFENYKKQQAAGGLTDIQRAARYYYLQRHSFAGRVRNRTFGVSANRLPSINLLRIEEELSAVHLRLVRVTIEHLPALDFIRCYDKPETLFYCDPPYHGAPCYEHNMGLDDYQRLAVALGELEGRFILSINDHPDMREVFGGFKIKPVTLKYTTAVTKSTKAKELIITNY